MVIMYCIDVFALSLSLSLSLSLHHYVVYIVLTCCNEPKRSASHVNMVLIEFCFCELLRGTRQDGIVTISPGPCD